LAKTPEYKGIRLLRPESRYRFSRMSDAATYGPPLTLDLPF